MPQAHTPCRPNPPVHFFRGQLTAEWLMVVLISLTLLGIAAAAISRASSAQTSLAERNILRMEAEEMGHYADEICVMGEGNARTSALAPVGFNLSFDEASKNLTISRNGWNYSRAVLCQIGANVTGYGALAYLRYQRMPDAAGTGRPAVLIAASP